MDEDKPFDAFEIYLCEEHPEPCARWRAVSLVTSLRGLLARGPGFERPVPGTRGQAIRATADELTLRGLDAAALMRYGMYREIAAPIISGLLIKIIFGDESAVDGVDVAAWCAALGIDASLPAPVGESEVPEVHTALFKDVIDPAIEQIIRWIARASLDEVINLAPPSAGDLAGSIPRNPGEREIRDQYRWAVDHFAGTFYRDWATKSLHYELRWLDGEILPPCPPEMMADRRVPRVDLLEEIAKRAVYDKGSSNPDEFVVDEMTRHARMLLGQDRVQDAVAVFEFGIRRRPDDPEIRNNLGFCLIPLDPSVALGHLKMAANMGYEPAITNTYNKMCCYVKMRRPRAALNLAEDEWVNGLTAPGSSTLWELREDGSWQLFDSDSVAEAVAAFAADIARKEGWKELVKTWEGRQAGLGAQSE